MLLTLPFMLQKQQFPIVRNLFYENSLLTAFLCQIHIWSVWLCIDLIEIESEMCGTALQELHNGMVQREARVPSVPNSYHPFDFDLYIPCWFLAKLAHGILFSATTVRELEYIDAYTVSEKSIQYSRELSAISIYNTAS